MRNHRCEVNVMPPEEQSSRLYPAVRDVYEPCGKAATHWSDDAMQNGATLHLCPDHALELARSSDATVERER